MGNGDKKLSERKRNRLKNYDYSQEGWYFVTIHAKGGKKIFGNVLKGKMLLNECGECAKNNWLQIPHHFSNVSLDEFIVMPNHIHGIIVIHCAESMLLTRASVGNRHACSLRPKQNESMRKQSLEKTQYQKIPVIIGSFKSSVSKQLHRSGQFRWQKSYHDHIIRNEESLERIREYIKTNPYRFGKSQKGKDSFIHIPSCHKHAPLL